MCLSVPARHNGFNKRYGERSGLMDRQKAFLRELLQSEKRYKIADVMIRLQEAFPNDEPAKEPVVVNYIRNYIKRSDKDWNRISAGFCVNAVLGIRTEFRTQWCLTAWLSSSRLCYLQMLRSRKMPIGNA